MAQLPGHAVSATISSRIDAARQTQTVGLPMD
jgi:hypothetical protein